DERLVAITGADMAPTLNGAPAPTWQSLTVKAGDALRLGPVRSGVRAYVAIAGGVQTPLVLESRATYPRGRLGGLEGRAVRKGDRLPLGRAAASPARRVRPDRIPAFPGEAEVAVILGPQDDRFTRAGIDAFLGGPYEILPRSDRLGARHKGRVVTHTRR